MEEGVPLVVLEPVPPIPRWRVELVPPRLPPPVDRWLSSDLTGVSPRVEALLEGVPLEALSWGDEGLSRAVDGLLDVSAPGWRKALLVRRTEGNPILQVGFVAESPLVLAVAPTLNSSTLPTLLYADLREDLLEGLSPMIGTPVPWVARHRSDLETWAAGILGGANRVVQSRSDSKVTAVPERITRVDARLESHRYVLWAWAAGYVGSNRYPEVGIHAGRKVLPFNAWEVELYGEWVVALDDGGVESRYGFRWSPWGDVWWGAEYVLPDDLWFGRLSLGGRVRSPYAWLRLSEEGESDFGLGYRINEHISLEVHYDERDDEPWSLKAIGNL
jgi:hypothetical protein